MIIGRQFVENQYEDERLYSTGNDELDEMLEKAFCEGYEYAQKEFGRTGLTAQQAKNFFKGGNGALNKAKKRSSEMLSGLTENAHLRIGKAKTPGAIMNEGVRAGRLGNSVKISPNASRADMNITDRAFMHRVTDNPTTLSSVNKSMLRSRFGK